MALTNRYSGIAKGAMVLTGNALACRKNQDYPPATGTSLYTSGQYITTDTSKQVLGYPVGTTTQYLENSSMAILNVPSGSTVLFAQLMWLVKNPISGTENNSIVFTTPAGTNNIPPTITDSVSGDNWKAANVISIVQAGIDAQPSNGQYTVGAVPGQNNPEDASIGASWALLVIYQNAALPYRYFNVNTGITAVSNVNQLTFNFTNFATPSQGTLKGYLLVNGTFGDLGDQAQVKVGSASPGTQIGNSSYPWNNLAPYSRINNMLPANILIADCQDPNIGLLDTRGTFGSYNVNPYGNGGAGSTPGSARVNYDIVGLDISNQLTNSQSNLYTNVTFIGTGSALVHSESVQVDINSANIQATKTVDKAIAYIGDTVLYTINMNNIGVIDAQNVILTDIIPPGLQFVNGSVVIGVTPTGDNPNAGISLGTITAGGSQIVKFNATANVVPVINPAINNATITYAFESVQGQPLIDGTSTTDDVLTLILPPLDINVQVALSAAPDTVGLGDDINYTANICNLSTRTITNSTFLCQLPEGTEYLPDSFTINGILQPGSNPFIGVILGDLIPTQCVTLGFKVRYIAKTCCDKIGCYCTLNFNYQDNPTTPIVNRTIKSNMVYTNKILDVMIIQ